MMRNAARAGVWAMCVCALVLAYAPLSAGSTVPTPWVNQDIGAVGVAGSTSATSGVFTVKGAGGDIWGSADAFQAVMQPITGDVQIVARVAGIQAANTYAKAGIMLRGSLTAGSAHVILDLRPNGVIEFMTRAVDGGSTTWLSGTTQPAPVWLKLTRTGTSVAGFVSPDGVSWNQVGATTLSAPAGAYVGLAVTSHDVTQLNTSTFDNVGVTGGGTLPAPWIHEDVGTTGLAGSSTYANGVFTVRGAGADIWGTADAFQAASQPLSGDAEVIARVTSMQNTNTYAKAGIMLRDSVAAGAAHVILDLRPNGAIEFMTRPVTGGATTWLASTTQPAPAWLKLSRSGSTVSGYVSANGTTWTPIGSTAIAFGASPIAALVVTSHDATQLNTATFDNVSAGPLPLAVAPPSTPSSPTPAAGATGVAGTPVTLTWTAGGATTYDVLFGTTNPPPMAASSLLTSSYDTSTLSSGTVYYWQVVAKNAGGSTSGPVWSFTTSQAAVTGVPTQYSAITDRLAYAKPALPQLGAAGFAFNDPTFGSRIMRVTDGQTRPGLVNRSYRVPSNAHVAAWNASSTRFFVVSNDGTIIPYTFDAQSMTASRIQPSSSDNGGLTLAFYVEPQFSLVDPNRIFGVGGSNNRTISSYDFSAGTYTTIVNLDTVVSGLSGYVGGLMTGGVPSETVMTYFGGGSQDQHYYALLLPLDGSPRKLLNTVASTINGAPTSTTLNFHIHGMQIDKSGRYVFIYPTAVDLGSPRYAAQVYLWDTATDVITPITASMHPGGHDAAGFGVWVNQDCCTSSTWDAAQWQIRSLAAPANTSDLISPVLTPKEVYLADHTTWNNAQPDRMVPVISSTYRYGTNTTAWRAWDDEIIGIDPASGIVYRFAHHRSSVGSDSNAAQPYFWYEPIANISPDGRWVLFTSNWEKTLGTDSSEGTARQDVFVVQLTPLQ